MDKKIEKMEKGDILRLLRVSLDLSILELSEKTKISNSYIVEIEKGRKNPSDEILERYSKGLDIPLESIKYLINAHSGKNSTYQILLIKILKKLTEI